MWKAYQPIALTKNLPLHFEGFHGLPEMTPIAFAELSSFVSEMLDVVTFCGSILQ